MFFCPNCDNIYSITKNPPVQTVQGQQGGKQYSESETPTSISDSETNSDNDIISMILKTGNYNKETNMKTIDEITKTPAYKKLSSKDKVFVKNKLMEQLSQEDKIKLMETNTAKSTSNAYFICKNCGTYEQIAQGTLVMSKLSTEGNHDFIDNTNYKNMIHVKTLPITRNYICPNDKCGSHKDHEKREAVFFRMGTQYRVRYVCKTCQISWI
jgi:Fe2+ or Zn2+ uptake regulation protein